MSIYLIDDWSRAIPQKIRVRFATLGLCTKIEESVNGRDRPVATQSNEPRGMRALHNLSATVPVKIGVVDRQGDGSMCD
jgi:hypothetical protein